MAWNVILPVYGADPIAEVKFFSILGTLYNQLYRLVFKHLLFQLDWQKILAKNRQTFQE
jgi:hypothetical protein